MRKIFTLSFVAGTALLVAACGAKTETAPADNAAAPEVNAADAMEGTTNDSMTNTDAAGAEANMSADNAASNAAANVADAAVNAAGNVAENAAK